MSTAPEQTFLFCLTENALLWLRLAHETIFSPLRVTTSSTDCIAISSNNAYSLLKTQMLKVMIMYEGCDQFWLEIECLP